MAILVAGTLLISIRGLTGKADLLNVPQAYLLPFSSYDRTVLVGSSAVCAMVCAYLSLRRFRLGRAKGTYGRGLPWIPYFIAACVALVGRLIILLVFGLGGKGPGASFAGSGYLLIGFESASLLLTITIMVSAFSTHDRRHRNAAIGLLLAHLAIQTIGGSRGGPFQVMVLLGASWLVSRHVRVNWRIAVRAALLVLVAVLGTSVAIEQRQRVSAGGGKEFGVVDFLFLRSSGTNRIAPVIDADLRVGWKRALFETPSIMKEDVYDIPASQKVGVSTHIIGTGYLAAGMAGAVVLGVLIGALARIIDMVASRQSGPVPLGLYIIAAVTLMRMMMGFHPGSQLKDLLGIVAVGIVMFALFPSHHQVRAVPVGAVTGRVPRSPA